MADQNFYNQVVKYILNENKSKSRSKTFEQSFTTSQFPKRNLIDRKRGNILLDEKKKEKSLVIGQCVVCSEDSTGVHFGVLTCEGCKSFFKRVVAKKEKYRCYFGLKCPITVETRNCCKACRYDKCIKAGMSIEAIRLGRKPKYETSAITLDKQIEASKAFKKIISTETCLPAPKPAILNNSIPRLINNQETEISSFNAHMQSVYMKHNNRIQTALNKAHAQIAMNSRKNAHMSLSDIWCGLLKSVNIEIKSMIAFVKEIPGIGNLYTSDHFLSLIEKRLFHHGLFMHTPLYMNGECFYVLPNGIQLTRHLFESIFTTEITKTRFEFMAKLNELKLTTKEHALLFPFVFTVSFKIAIEEEFRANHEYYKRALVYEMYSNGRDLQFIHRLNEIFKILEKLHELERCYVIQMKPEY